MAGPETLDRVGFAAAVRRFGPELRVYCIRLCGGREALGDEILQSAFQVAWTRRETFRGGNLRAWLYCIARQQGLWRLRSERRYVDLAPERLAALCEEAAPEPEEGPDPAQVARMRDCFEELPPVDRTLVQAAYGLRPLPPEVVEGAGGDAPERLTYEELGRVLEIEHGGAWTPDRVRMRLKRALARMLTRMGAAATPPGEGRP